MGTAALRARTSSLPGNRDALTSVALRDGNAGGNHCNLEGPNFCVPFAETGNTPKMEEDQLHIEQPTQLSRLV